MVEIDEVNKKSLQWLFYKQLKGDSNMCNVGKYYNLIFIL